jgi:hypothetical protein
MPKAQGLGMGAFFAATHEPRTTPEPSQPTPRIRTSITLTMEDAERLEMLRMHLRRRQGRGLTYSDVVGMALQRLAEIETFTSQPPET